ncbi:TetR/AcrR family transcriptional regulator [Mycobacterium sp. SMC-4]|uniref:TetR/AcrR family transcriptional regulator n=1 Tax=Mycobacterium sp. SMC-4 TaxID=2857059 RepID=UPI0021B1A9EB|nr:TetR/AcrR family transcriptional regulator [Mycobacterium sp. SMC-4]UXA17009.1 TetR/AcrR family transcriptional regulator [Mycobacterium sp. SMC-4]
MADETDKSRVLAAATELFNERGVQAVGMDAIRDAAGIPLKRLYSYFPSKAALISAVLKQRDRATQQAMANFVEQRTDDPRERILAVFDYLGSWFAETDFRGCMFINSVGELGGTSPEVRRIARANKVALRDYLADLVAAAGLPSAYADELAILANGAIVAATIYGDGPEAAGSARHAATTILASA